MKNLSKLASKYLLSGGASCVVYKPFSKKNYGAVIDIDGQYPNVGMVAKNNGRREFSVIISGHFTYCINETVYDLNEGDTILVGDGDEYAIAGKGKVLVVVEDKMGGKTDIYEK